MMMMVVYEREYSKDIADMILGGIMNNKKHIQGKEKEKNKLDVASAFCETCERT